MIYLLPFLVVVISYLMVRWLRPKGQGNTKLLLAFSGSFLLALTFFELLPEVYVDAQPKLAALFILIGVLLQVFLESFSMGAEHGHVHHSINGDDFPKVLFFSICLHALVEGIPIAEGNGMLYAILVHKLPIAIILSTFLIRSDLKKAYVFLFMVVFALMTPLGSYLANQLTVFEAYKPYLSALAVGVFLHVSTVILFESSQGHGFNLRKLIVIVLGIGLAFVM
ncbi:MAG: ZIP family metal transporter [Flavobacteriaceae bacterium]|nr:ZIP family metal transporter [Flavobacteriaceae bacterium]